MKLLLKFDRPELNVSIVISHWFITIQVIYMRIKLRQITSFVTCIVQYTIGMVGYGDDLYETTVLELIYTYGVTRYTKGNAYEQVCYFSTNLISTPY